MRRPHYFLMALLATFFNPLVLALYGVSETFIVVVPLTLLVWFAVKWDAFTKLDAKSSLGEIILGMGIYSGNFARNILTNSIFGIFDMLVVLVGLMISFFGLRAIRQHFLLPTAYLGVLVVTYQIENRLPEIQVLQNFLAQTVVGVLNPIGVKASIWSLNQDIITVWGRQGIPGPNPFALWIEKNCTGVKGMLAYGSLAILMILDITAPIRRKLMVVLVGLAGTFLVNIGRLLVIFLSAYQWGVDAGLAVHAYLGYGLFIAWVLVYWTLSFRYFSGPRASLAQSTPQTPL